MAVLQLLANGILQQLVQPFAMGAAPRHSPARRPGVVVTIGGGALFGAAGLILAAPVVAAIVKIWLTWRGLARRASVRKQERQRVGRLASEDRRHEMGVPAPRAA